MRILLITKSYPPADSAQSIQMGLLVQALRLAGSTVRVIAGKEFTSQVNTGAKDEDIHYVQYGVQRPSTSKVGRVWNIASAEARSCFPRSGWVRAANKQALDTTDEFRPSVIISASQPFDAHIVGLLVHRLTRLPWVASFSDPWPSRLLPKPYSRSSVPLLSRLQLRQLRIIFRECTAVHMPTQYAFDHIGRALGQFLSPKSLVIPHIASPGSIAPWGGQDLENWLVHVGHMTRERCSRALLEAVVTARKVIGKRFHGLLCIGDVSQTFHRYISELNAYDVVRLHGRVPSVEAAAAVQAARVLLLVEAEMSFSPFLPSKFANYACSGKTLLAITPGQSATRGYLSRYGGGIAVENAPKAILEALLKLFASNPADRPAGNVNLYRNLFSANAIGLTWSNSLSTLLAKPSGLQEYCQECHYL